MRAGLMPPRMAVASVVGASPLHTVYKEAIPIVLEMSNPVARSSRADLSMSSPASSSSHSIASSTPYVGIIPKDLSINWKDVYLMSKDSREATIGKGSFGIVVKARWVPKTPAGGMGMAQEVAIKVFSNGLVQSVNFETLAAKVVKEAKIMKHAERNLVSDCYVKVYGIAHGTLPRNLAAAFGVNDGIKAIGLVMRYESGGDLNSYLFTASGQPKIISTLEKMHLIHGIIRALAEFHAVGIIHGDLKPDNVLLHNTINPEIRLADFGLSAVRGANDLAGSTLHQTSNTKGTLAYCAPEMLFDPFRTDGDSSVARASRKTDVYAFGLLAWEVLSQQRPFGKVKSEAELGWNVHQGVRPPMDALPDDTPKGMELMIEQTWAKDRTERPSAIECYAITNFHYQVLSKKTIDIFISHASVSKNFLSHIYSELVQCGFRIWYDQNDANKEELESRLFQSRRDCLKESKVFVACVNRAYQANTQCMRELRRAATRYKKFVITVSIEPDIESWASPELREYCNLSGSQFIDISNVSALPWDRDEDASADMIERLQNLLVPILRILSKANCFPSAGASNNLRMDVLNLLQSTMDASK